MRTWKNMIILLLCLVVAGATACGSGGDQETQQLVEVERGDLTVSVSGSGSIAVSDEATLAFGTSGKIYRIYVEKGNEVKKGETLAQLDTGSLELAVAQVKASQKQAEYNLEKTSEPYSEDDIDSAERAVDLTEDYLEYAKWMLDHAEEAEEKAEDYLEYVKWMLDHAEEAEEKAEDYLEYVEQLPYNPEEFDIIQEKIAAAEAQLDQATAAVEQWRMEVSRAEADLANAEVRLESMMEVSRAEADLANAEVRLESMKDAPDEGAVEAAEAQLEAATQALAQAQKQLDEAIIIAPFDGVVADVNAEEGDVITPASPVVHLVDLTSMELEVVVDEIDINEVKPGQRAIIEIDALPSLQLDGEVISISTLSIEMGGVVLYEVTISFDGTSSSAPKPGMSASADIIIHEKNNVLLVPDRAIKQGSGGGKVVEVIVGEQIEEKTVVIGISDGLNTEIISGLTEGETIVIQR